MGASRSPKNGRSGMLLADPLKRVRTKVLKETFWIRSNFRKKVAELRSIFQQRDAGAIFERSFYMPKFDSPLNNVKIASPCSAEWNEMYGNERKRFCGDCKLNVYNLSGMTKSEAEDLLLNSEGRLCIRFYKRADGTVLTADCPVGWAKVKQRTRLYATAALSLVMALLSGVFMVSLFTRQSPTIGQFRMPFLTPTPTPEHTMGVMAPRPTPSPSSNANTSKP